MATPTLKQTLTTEAVGAVVFGCSLLVWTGVAARAVAVPQEVQVFGLIRIAAVLLIGFGAVLWGVRQLVPTRELLIGLAVSHTIGAVMLIAQHIAIWNNRVGFVLAAVPMVFAIRYIQHAVKNGSVARAEVPS